MEYIIAGIRIAVPQEFTAGSFGMALAPFAAADKGPAGLSVETRSEIRQADGYRELDEFDFADADADCRFGRDAEGYLLTMTPRDGSAAARFRKAFGAPLVTTDVTLRHNPALFRFGLWSMFNIAAVARQAVAIHSSVISLNGGAVLFLGESGTGKSTHTRLWREHIPGAELLNDDSPIVRIVQTADADPICGAVQNPAKPPQLRLKLRTQAQRQPAPQNRRPWSSVRRGAENAPATATYASRSGPSYGCHRPAQPVSPPAGNEAIGALLPSCPPSFAHDETLEDAVCATVSPWWRRSRSSPRMPARRRGRRTGLPHDFRRRIRKSPVMQLSNRLFFEQVEAMLAEGHEVQIRMKATACGPAGAKRTRHRSVLKLRSPDTPKFRNGGSRPKSKTGSRETKPPPTPPQNSTRPSSSGSQAPCNQAT